MSVGEVGQPLSNPPAFDPWCGRQRVSERDTGGRDRDREAGGRDTRLQTHTRLASRHTLAHTRLAKRQPPVFDAYMPRYKDTHSLVRHACARRQAAGGRRQAMEAKRLLRKPLEAKPFY